MIQKLKQYGMPAGSLLMVILYPCLFMYFQNVDEGYFFDILPAVGKFLVLAVVIFLVGYVFLRDYKKSVLYTELVMLVAMNSNSILKGVRTIVEGFPRLVFAGIVGVIFLLLLFLFKKKLKDVTELCMILGIVFGILIAVNFVGAIPNLAQKVTHVSVDADKAISEETFTKETPNVYYLLYDEYGGFENVKRYYDHDNSELMNFFETEGFTYSAGSKNTEAIFTTTVIPNLMNLSYVASDTIYSVDNLKMLENAQMIQLFRNNGYEVNLINHTNLLNTLGCNVLNSDSEEESLSTYILENSIFWSIDELVDRIVIKLTGKDTSYVATCKEAIFLIETCADYRSKQNPTFTIGYLNLPHAPLIFRADGSVRPESEWYNWEDKSMYLEQYKYITSHIMKTVTNIKNADPDALIIVQSDHGNRYPHWMVSDYDWEKYEYDVEMPYMMNIINGVYYKGETFEIEGMTGINTMRTVFNEVLGTNFEMVYTDDKPIVETAY